MIYDFTLLSGWEFSGVDVAQGFRARVFAKNNIPSKFVFMTLPTKRDVELYTGQGILTEQMMVSQLYMAGCQNLKVTVTTEEILERQKGVLDYDESVKAGANIQLKKNGVLIAEIETNECGYFIIVNYYVQNHSYMKNYYLDRLVCTEYSEMMKDGKKELPTTKRIYWSDDGKAAFEEILGEGDRTYLFPNGEKVDSIGFIDMFIQKLNLTKEDTCLLDRAGYMDFTQALFRHKAQAKLVAVLHSKHYYEKFEDDGSLYMNYEYYYWFKYSEKIDMFVVGTEEQKEDLKQELQRHNSFIPRIIVISPGALHQKEFPESKRFPCGIITASRLNPKKRVDLIIKSVAKAHEKNPDIFLDIYGTGYKADVDYLKQITKQIRAEEFVRFMGQQNLERVYSQYELYITLSMGETFGLSLMEAVGSGLAMIGLDAKYGNHLFIHSGENGYLMEYDKDQDLVDQVDLVERMSDKIVEIFADRERLEAFHRKSYEIADQYEEWRVADKWIRLFSSDT